MLGCSRLRSQQCAACSMPGSHRRFGKQRAEPAEKHEPSLAKETICVCVCVCTPVCRAETERLFARLPRVVTMMPFPVITFYIEFLASSGNNSCDCSSASLCLCLLPAVLLFLPHGQAPLNSSANPTPIPKRVPGPAALDRLGQARWPPRALSWTLRPRPSFLDPASFLWDPRVPYFILGIRLFPRAWMCRSAESIQPPLGRPCSLRGLPSLWSRGGPTSLPLTCPWLPPSHLPQGRAQLYHQSQDPAAP